MMKVWVTSGFTWMADSGVFTDGEWHTSAVRASCSFCLLFFFFSSPFFSGFGSDSEIFTDGAGMAAATVGIFPDGGWPIFFLVA
ncbi:hypothetical protein MRB53_030646 [Persea americana]|uniref:Uncharacterized protein n=1 Tax=Persea americana TaxID=3435 RepID=A0ACC2KM70_PERAE|nr:hypothetical protein MRB53_030646 [Persea americana]